MKKGKKRDILIRSKFSTPAISLCIHPALCHLICVDWLIFKCGLKLNPFLITHTRSSNMFHERDSIAIYKYVLNILCSVLRTSNRKKIKNIWNLDKDVFNDFQIHIASYLAHLKRWFNFFHLFMFRSDKKREMWNLNLAGMGGGFKHRYITIVMCLFLWNHFFCVAPS